MASTIVKTSLPEYVDQNSSDLLIKAMTGAKTLRHIEQYLGVKYKTALNILDSEVVFADGSECGFNAQGTDTLSQRILTALPIKINKEWCDRTLIDTFANHELRMVAGQETMPFEEKFVNSNLAEIAKKLDTLIWQGDEALGAEGFIDLASALDSGVISAEANSITALVDEVYTNIPSEALDRGAVIFLSDTNYRSYVSAHNANCCGNMPIIDAREGEMQYPGDSRVTIVGVGGLEGTNYVVGSAKDNFVYGTDVRDAHATFKVWYSDDADLFRFKVLFTAGVQFKFPGEVVFGAIA